MTTKVDVEVTVTHLTPNEEDKTESAGAQYADMCAPEMDAFIACAKDSNGSTPQVCAKLEAALNECRNQYKEL